MNTCFSIVLFFHKYQMAQLCKTAVFPFPPCCFANAPDLPPDPLQHINKSHSTKIRKCNTWYQRKNIYVSL